MEVNVQTITCRDSITHCTLINMHGRKHNSGDTILKASFDLQGQLVPSGLLAAVLPSGQQPNSLLSQEALSSAVGKVVLKTVKPGGNTMRGENSLMKS